MLSSNHKGKLQLSVYRQTIQINKRPDRASWQSPPVPASTASWPAYEHTPQSPDSTELWGRWFVVESSSWSRLSRQSPSTDHHLHPLKHTSSLPTHPIWHTLCQWYFTAASKPLATDVCQRTVSLKAFWPATYKADKPLDEWQYVQVMERLIYGWLIGLVPYIYSVWLSGIVYSMLDCTEKLSPTHHWHSLTTIKNWQTSYSWQPV